MSISSFIRRLSYEKNYAQNTILSYEQDLKNFEDFLQRDISMATNQEIISYIQEISPRFSATSLSRKLSCLRSFYKDLVRLDLRQDNPMHKICLPKTHRKLPELVSEQELDELFDSFEINSQDFATLRDMLIFELLYSCGLRVSELCQLTLNSIYIEEEVLRILGKGNKERLIPMGRRLKELLSIYLPVRFAYLKGINCAYVITSKFRKHVSRMFIWKVLKKYSQQLQITELHPHMLRHAFATHMLNHGADLRIIQELLGHSDLSTTEIYTHVASEKLYETLIQHHPLAQETLLSMNA